MLVVVMIRVVVGGMQDGVVVMVVMLRGSGGDG